MTIDWTSLQRIALFFFYSLVEFSSKRKLYFLNKRCHTSSAAAVAVIAATTARNQYKLNLLLSIDIPFNLLSTNIPLTPKEGAKVTCCFRPFLLTMHPGALSRRCRCARFRRRLGVWTSQSQDRRSALIC